MEEDIKILEEILNRDIEDTEGTKIMKKAIQNLIARNKELEERSDRINKQNIEYRNTLEKLQKNTIWKSKVKKIIDELEAVLSFGKTGKGTKIKIQCEILENVINKLHKELLEEEN